MTRRPAQRLALFLALGAYAAVVLRTAWLSDDAFITFRVVDNLFAGHGLRWNPAERVQSFTHPLWLLVLSVLRAVTREIPVTALLASVAVALGGAALAVRYAATLPQALLVLAGMILSRSYVDYSTSGLESPLSHLLAVAFFGASLSRDERPVGLRRLALLAGLLALNRLDSLLLTAPTLAALALRPPLARRFREAALGFAPLAAWLVFATWYYGTPLPNTAYAKLNTGVPLADLLFQGGMFLLDSLSRDPVTLLLIATACLTPAIARRPGAWPAALGIALYLAYVVRIGGDFMSGRFLSLPLAGALALLARAPVPLSGLPAAVAVAAVAVLGLATPFPTVSSNASYFADRSGKREHLFGGNGIVDERGIFYRDTGLMSLRRHEPFPRHYFAVAGRKAYAEGTELAERGALGMYAFFAGPGLHVIDPNALCDPLLARLPALPGWRIGHFEREIPAGYRRTLRTGPNRIEDPDLRAFYDVIRSATRDPLLDPGRLRAVLALNLGAARALEDYFAFHSRPRRVALSALGSAPPEGAEWNEGTTMSRHGLEVDLGRRRRALALELSLDGNDRYSIELLREGRPVWRIDLDPAGAGLSPLRVQPPAAVGAAGFDAVRVIPLEGDRRYALGFLRLAAGPSREEVLQ